MATPEHIQLSTFIKNVHIKLRKQSKQLGFDAVWQEHCQNDSILQEYASSMKKLATEYWEKNAENDEKVISRITWVYENCDKYFGEELLRQRNRELEVTEKLLQVPATFSALKSFECINVLDVGSCYNPFKIYKKFSVVPIDIAPSCDDVYKCDFLNVTLSEANIFNVENNSVICLEKGFFHAVIFSLFVEYIPSPEKRLECCQRAYDLLDYEGLLIIITPDSKHVGANAKYMKSWRYALSLIGFARIKYEKLPYLHCMVFRKAISINYSKRWAEMHANDGLDNFIFIPQDFYENE